jgi:hypothetical protein
MTADLPGSDLTRPGRAAITSTATSITPNAVIDLPSVGAAHPTFNRLTEGWTGGNGVTDLRPGACLRRLAGGPILVGVSHAVTLQLVERLASALENC